MNAVLHQPSLPPLSSRAIGLDVSCSPSPSIEACQHNRLLSMKRKATQNFTVLSATRPEISVLEQTALSTDVPIRREPVDGALKGSRNPQKGAQSDSVCKEEDLDEQAADIALLCCRAWHGATAVIQSAAESRAACVDIVPDRKGGQQELG